ncbi:Gfo/Idh/MocA family oxidoreductase (plasmid) [Paracoccus liaowanqingii]|uniref:Gfo/Idh/MocA family oxidoreductase n=1 Tax=Paracoccus liaowanqingii TaxID=2560053 RepID=A0A4Y5SU42_9RHOB|nr:Gfo/Idh/MocA family oxidoreductase [Paracoccus liaowanqingii]QDA36295.1 Gfo/Idh/MocA family oxidoreductase [Paracoccus liaowanqingii]
MTETRKTVWGVLSTANIAVNQVIPALQKSERLVVGAIASRDEDRATAVARSLGIARAYGDYDALLDDPEIDIVYNPLPNHLHVPWTLRALEAGKHVLCEKPLALSAAEAASLIETSQRTGKNVREAFMIRDHPQWLRARELVQGGALGEVRAIHVSFCYDNRDPANVRNQLDIGGGALFDIGCYAVAVGRFIFACEPERVVAEVDRDPDFGTDRLTSAIMVFPGGRRLVFTCATQLVRSQDVQIIGTTGRVSIAVPFNQSPDREARLLMDDGTVLKGGDPAVETFGPVDQYLLQAEAFSDLCVSGSVDPYGLQDAIRNMSVIDALWSSEETRGWADVRQD